MQTFWVTQKSGEYTVSQRVVEKDGPNFVWTERAKFVWSETGNLEPVRQGYVEEFELPEEVFYELSLVPEFTEVEWKV